MKPWSKGVFPPLVLTTEQEEEFQHLAHGLIRETLAHFDTFDRLPPQKRDLTRQKRWKAVKTRENLTVFKERDPPKSLSATSFGPPEHQRLAEDDWQMPKLLVGVGSIVGSLDDVMYGVVTPDAESMLLKASIVRSALVDGAVLVQIAGPTPNEPYQFLGVKWFVKGPPATLRGFVQARDLVFIESTGTRERSNGDRIGYQLLHSVDLEGCGALQGRAFTRGRISSCTIFKESRDRRRVDVYVRGYVEQHGKLLDSVALKAASTGFLSSWNAVECGHVKKLMWFVENPHLVSWRDEAAVRAQGSRSPALSESSSRSEPPSNFHLRSLRTGSSPRDRCGGTCGRPMKKVSSVGLCSLCQVPMCSKCRVTKKLAYVTCDLTLGRRESVICRSCVAKVRLQPVRRIAQEEIRRGRYDRKQQPVEPDPEVALEMEDRAPSSMPPQSPVPMLSPSKGSTPKQASSGSRFHIGGPSHSRSARPNRGFLERMHQLEQQRAEAQPSAQNAGHQHVLPTKSRWFKRHKSVEQHKTEPRPVMFGESTPLSECQSGPLSQCSTMDSINTTSPVNPLAISWASSAHGSEIRARVEEDSKDDWANTPEFTDSQQERRQLWNQMTELRLAVENTYQIVKQTTDSCCGSSVSPAGKMSVHY